MPLWKAFGAGTAKESRVKHPFKGEVRMVVACLDYKGTDGELGCTVDGERLVKVARKDGKVRDIVKLYDDGSTQLFPSVDGLTEAIQAVGGRCKPEDYFVLVYSGHGTEVEDEDGDEESGIDQALCLRTQEGEDETMLDDVLAETICGALDPSVRVLMIADCCHSGTILDAGSPCWAGRRVVGISGCQDRQCSQDTGDGGAMTLALLSVLGRRDVRKGRLTRKCSVQMVFNRMVEEMPDDEDDEYDEEDDEYDEEDDESERDSSSEYDSEEEEAFEEALDEVEEWSKRELKRYLRQRGLSCHGGRGKLISRVQDFMEEEWEEEDEDEGEDEGEGGGEEPEPGQNINLSWGKGTRPAELAFPF